MAEALTIDAPSSLNRFAFPDHWQQRLCDERLIFTLSQRYDLPEVIARILAGRGIALEEAEHFLNPSLKHSLPDPSAFLDMEKAAARIVAAVEKGERIAIFGDYDVDGATSSALLVKYLNQITTHDSRLTPLIYIPDRMKEGYGPNAVAMETLKAKGASLVITVDCGTTAFDALAHAKALGMEVIVVDHHQSETRLPEAHAIINPNRFDETSPHRQLAAVGVTFLLLVAVNRALRGKYPEPNLIDLLDLVALGTICDVVPLTGVNRAFVTQGLRVMAQRKNLGLATLMDIARLDSAPGTYHAGFILGPRINAGGRVGKSDLGVRLLTTSDPDEAMTLAKELDRHNDERKAIESFVQEDAMAQAEMQANAPMIFAAADNWHPGVIGIVAGRLKEKFHKPVAVTAFEKGIGKASLRSVPGIDIGALVAAAKHAGLLLNGGGHAAAAGFTVEQEKYTALQDFMLQRLEAMGVAELLSTRSIAYDGIISIEGITLALAQSLERAGPFGPGNPAPRLVIPHVFPLDLRVVGENHIRLLVKDAARTSSSARLKAMAFRAADTPLGQLLLSPRRRPLHLLGQLRISHWQGEAQVEMHLEDAVYAD